MIKQFRNNLCVCFFLLAGICLSKGDSLYILKLKNVITKISNEKNKIDSLNKLSGLVRVYSTDEAKLYANKAISLSEKIDYPAGDAFGYTNLGGVEKILSNFEKANNYFFKALAIWEKEKNNTQIAVTEQQISEIYQLAGDYKLSLAHGFKALKLAEGEPDKDYHLLGNIYGTIAQIYSGLEDPNNSILYNLKALSCDSVLKNDHGFLSRYNNIGTIYEHLKQFDKALEYYTKALAICEKMNYKFGYCIIMTNVGNIYRYKGNLAKALECQEISLKIAKEINATLYEGYAYSNMAAVFLDQKQYKKAIEFYLKGIEIDKNFNALGELVEDYKTISMAYEKSGDYKNSLAYHQMYVSLKDSVIGEDNQRQINDLLTKYDSEKKDNQLKIQTLELDNKDAALGKQRLFSILIGLGLLCAIITAIYIFRGYKQKKEANNILAEKNKIIEEKQKEITDSILYAKRIQSAIMASDKLLKENLTDFFVLYQPKDIVSGDFYWAANIVDENKNKIFSFATCDCTGHGVPGAFMSLLNISFLNEVTIQKNITQPDLIFNEVRTGIINALNPDGSMHQAKDGMDAVLCNFNFAEMKLEFACANNPVLLVRNNEIIKYSADKFPVGLSYGELKPFSKQVIELKKNDIIYTFTDGYGDQFGGAKGKKFKYKNLEALLLKNSGSSFLEQKEHLEKTIKDWKGNLEQVDDILIVGIRV